MTAGQSRTKSRTQLYVRQDTREDKVGHREGQDNRTHQGYQLYPHVLCKRGHIPTQPAVSYCSGTLVERRGRERRRGKGM